MLKYSSAPERKSPSRYSFQLACHPVRFERDGIAFYAFPPNNSIPTDTIPIYRFYNEATSAATGTPVHFFTGSEENKNNVIDNFVDFIYEGPAWYALSADGF